MANFERHSRKTVAADPEAEVRYPSAAYNGVLDELRLLAAHPGIPILLYGDSGTGKSMVARWIHDHSPRAAGPFLPINVSGLDDTLASSALFGHVAGAFTGARDNRLGAFVSAIGGTLALDELGKSSRDVQRRLLHAVDTGEIQPVGSDRIIRVDVRIIAATSLRLEQLVAEGRFDDDLLARLEPGFCMPGLCERRADIPALVYEFIARDAPGCGYTRMPVVQRELMAALCDAPWPHNIRQLKQTVLLLLIKAERAPVLTLELCRHGVFTESLARLVPHPGLTPESAARALREAGGNKRRAARRLGVARSTLDRAIHRFDAEGPSHLEGL